MTSFRQNIGMQIMDDAIFTLLQEGKISAKEAFLNASNKDRFKPLAEKEKQTGSQHNV